MNHNTTHSPSRTQVPVEGRLMRVVDAIDHAVDSRLPQSDEAVRRRKIAVRTLGGAVAVAVAVGGYGALPKKIASEKVTVEQGEAISDVLHKAQEQAAADNPNIDPADTSYVSAASALEHDQEINGQKGYVQPGQTVEVDYARNWYGKNAVSAHIMPNDTKQ